MNNNNENNMNNETEKRRGKIPLIAADTFKEVWNNSGNVDEVVDVFFPNAQNRKQRKAHCCLRATALRKQGLVLKKFQVGRRPK